MADPVGIALATSDGTLVETPTWTRLDTTYNVQGWTIDRQKIGELEVTGTGTATIDIVDKTGAFSPTGTCLADSMMQAAICMQNPVTSAWSTLFRGFIDTVEWQPYQNERFANCRLNLVDAMALLAAAEMLPDGQFGDSVDNGNIIYNADATTDAVQTRINQVLTEYGWAAGLRRINTGNCKLLEGVYAERTSVLTPILEAAAADLDAAAVVYAGGPRNPGHIVFDGRLPRFDPTNPDYELETWLCGDDLYCSSSPSTRVRLSPPLMAYRDARNLYTSAFCIPNDPTGAFSNADIAGQYVTDGSAVTLYGLRTWSAPNSLNGGGTSTSALEETLLQAQWIVDSFSAPLTRVGQLTFTPKHPGGVNGAATWDLLCNIEISDRVYLETTWGMGAGFAEYFFVDGIHYEATPGNGAYPDVTLTLDVFPASVYASYPEPA